VDSRTFNAKNSEDGDNSKDVNNNRDNRNGINSYRLQNELHQQYNVITTVKKQDGSFLKSYKMTCQRQEKTHEVTSIGQSHLRNPEAALNGFMILS
jgi:hypothetical protein